MILRCDHGYTERRRSGLQRDIIAESNVAGELADKSHGDVGGAERAQVERRKPIIAAILPAMEQSSGEAADLVKSRRAALFSLFGGLHSNCIPTPILLRRIFLLWLLQNAS